MQRTFSTAAASAWGAYHAVSGLGFGAQAAGFALALPAGLALPALGSPATGAGALAALHLALSLGFALAVRRLHQGGADGERAEIGVLVALLGSLVLAAGFWFAGLSAGQAGLFSGAVAVTAFALFFDRLTVVDDEQDEANYRAFLHAGASLGVSMHHTRSGDRERG